MTGPAPLLNQPLVVRSPNWLGDAVMALPAVRNLKTKLMGEPLTVATPAKLAALWQACPFVDKVIALEKPRILRTSAAQLRAGHFASAVLLPNSLRAAGEARLAGIPHIYGYARSGRSLLLTHSYPVPLRDPVRLHQSFYYLDLMTALGAPPDPSMPELTCPLEKWEHDQFVIALCPGAEYGPAKRWPVENFATFANYVLENWQVRILLLGAPGDVEVADRLVPLISKEYEIDNRVGKTSLAQFMTALASSNLVVCNDSGAMHVAAALRVPTLALFGSTEPLLTGPLGGRALTVRHHTPCSPCFLRECPIDFACMKSLTPEMVIAAAGKLF